MNSLIKTKSAEFLHIVILTFQLKVVDRLDYFISRMHLKKKLRTWARISNAVVKAELKLAISVVVVCSMANFSSLKFSKLAY